MPVPQPSKGEKRDEFVARFMGNETMKKEYPDQKQRLAVAFTTWRKAKGIKQPKSKMGLKFNYQVPILENAYVDDTFVIQGTALNATITSNNHKFLSEELKLSADTLTGVPLLVDHRNEVSAIKGRVLIGQFDEEANKVNFRAKVVDEDMKKMIKDGRIDSVSVGADVKEVEETDDGLFIPRGIKFRELSLVAVPADEGATFNVALKEAYELNAGNIQLNKTGGKRMSEDTQTQDAETGKETEDTKDTNDSTETTEDAVETEEKEVEAKLRKAELALKKQKLKAMEKQISESDSDESSEETEDTEETEDAEDDTDEEDKTEEKGKYKVIQSAGSLKGGAFTVVRA